MKDEKVCHIKSYFWDVKFSCITEVIFAQQCKERRLDIRETRNAKKPFNTQLGIKSKETEQMPIVLLWKIITIYEYKKRYFSVVKALQVITFLHFLQV